MAKLNFTVAAEKCTRCGECVRDCPSGIIALHDQLPQVSTEDEPNCLACEHCLAVCPTGAVSVFGLEPQASIPLTAEALPGLQSMEALVRGRRSVRQYRQENVPRDVLDRLLADLAHAPTGCNARALSFLVSDNRDQTRAILNELVEALEKKRAAGTVLPEFLDQGVAAFRERNEDWLFRGAPQLLIVTADKTALCGKEDVVLAVAYFELLANCAGLGTCWCGLLPMALDVIPEFKARLGIAPDAAFYSILFGLPAVHYARTVQRESSAAIRRIAV
jgi:nitroreductase/NAD-dependent dihydropyrimidine dehydrogenase PreA subunit